MCKRINMDNKLLQILNNREVKLPKLSAEIFFRVALSLKSLSTHPKYYYHFNKKEMKHKQVVLISDHASRDTFYYTLHGYNMANPNVVMGFQNIFIKGLFKPFLDSGVIVKSLYEADLKAIKQMFDVVKMGGSLCLFPEGVQSTSGSTHPMNPSTIKFLKKLSLDVVLCKSYGTYLSRPRYSRSTRKGPIEIHYEVLFTKDELKNLSIDELYKKYLERFKYNDFTWNKERKYKYIGKESNATGITKILYYCPKCGHEFTLEEKENSVVCKTCGNEIKIDEGYNLIPVNASTMPYTTIDEWFKAQRKLVQKEIAQDNFQITYDVYSVDLYYDKLRKDQYYIDGEGSITINKEGIRFVGTKKDEKVDILFELINTPSFLFTPGKENDIYYHGTYFCFRPKIDNLKVVKYMLYVEELHNRIDEAWGKVSRDVYE